MSLLSPVTPENAHLVANLYGNLGGLYHQQGNTELAKQAMEQGISLLEQYQLLYMNDSIVQICNYAALLTDTGEASRGLSSLRKCARLVKELQFRSVSGLCHYSGSYGNCLSGTG